MGWTLIENERAFARHKAKSIAEAKTKGFKIVWSDRAPASYPVFVLGCAHQESETDVRKYPHFLYPADVRRFHVALEALWDADP